MNYVIFVVYYQEYFNESLAELDEMLMQIFDDYKIIIVCNNKQINKVDDVFEFLYSNDISSEFAAYQTGLNYLRDNSLINTISGLNIFVNDTFMYHRDWIKDYKIPFTKALAKLSKTQENIFLGEVDRGSTIMIWDSIRFNEWVSSYFFVLPKEIIFDESFTFLLSQEQQEHVVDVTENKVIWKNNVDTSLMTFINSWMNPENKFGWKGSKSSAIRRRKKVLAILSEYNLTINIIKRGTKIVDIFEYSGIKYRTLNLAKKKLRGLQNRIDKLKTQYFKFK